MLCKNVYDKNDIKYRRPLLKNKKIITCSSNYYTSIIHLHSKNNNLQLLVKKYSTTVSDNSYNNESLYELQLVIMVNEKSNDGIKLQFAKTIIAKQN